MDRRTALCAAMLPISGAVSETGSAETAAADAQKAAERGGHRQNVRQSWDLTAGNGAYSTKTVDEAIIPPSAKPEAGRLAGRPGRDSQGRCRRALQ
jgi:hypothetical protein